MIHYQCGIEPALVCRTLAMKGNRRPRTCIRLRMLACLLPAFAGHLHAQQASGLPPGMDVPTLEHVQALPPDEEILALDRFENPINIEPNRFDKVYDPGITPEEIALEHGGYINYGINLGLYKSWQGIKKVTGMRPETEHATARPPPLTEAQLRRALMVCEDGGNACPARD